ncbi:MAG: hypothetical protein ABIY63_15260, partial [Fibrobacteria bacterium]
MMGLWLSKMWLPSQGYARFQPGMIIFSPMRIHVRFILFLALLFQFATPISAFGVRRDGKLDQPALSKAYRESEWIPVRNALEGYVNHYEASKIDIDERIFAYKYLGVIYASDSLTRTRAESYFNRLLELSPNIEIVDMYASKKIIDFFHEVKRDYLNQVAYSSTYDEFGHKIKSPGSVNDSVRNPRTDVPAPRTDPNPKQTHPALKKSNSWV